MKKPRKKTGKTNYPNKTGRAIEWTTGYDEGAKAKTNNAVITKGHRKKISKMGWGIKWTSGKIDFYTTKRNAEYEIDYFNTCARILFRCKIEEVTK